MTRRVGVESQKATAAEKPRIGWAMGFIGLRDGAKRDSSAPQADCFAGAKQGEKASACFGRNDWAGWGGVSVAKIRWLKKKAEEDYRFEWAFQFVGLRD
jgi:hypothetical protein